MNTADNHIVRNINVMNGKPVIIDTRITVELILRKLSEGVTIAQFQEMYPQITEVQIFAALEYASNLISNENILEVS